MSISGPAGRTPEQIADEMPVREYILTWARRAIGSHYLRGCFGQHPGEVDEVRRDRTLELVEDTNWRTVALHTAVFQDRRCQGRNQELEPYDSLANHNMIQHSQQLRPYYREVEQYVNDNRATPSDSLPSFHGYYPRRLQPGGDIYLGEDCRQKRHFDCIGLVDWVLTIAFNEPFAYSIRQLYDGNAAGILDTSRCELMPADIAPGDILVRYNVSRLEEHVAFVADRQHLLHAFGTQWGVKLTGLVDFGSYKAICRVNRNFLNRRGWRTAA